MKRAWLLVSMLACGGSGNGNTAGSVALPPTQQVLVATSDHFATVWLDRSTWRTSSVYRPNR